MLEKLVLFVVTLVVTVASSFAPPGFLVRTDVDGNLSPAVDAPLETSLLAPTQFSFATVDSTGFNTFARLSVLSVSINGQLLTRDEWGSGFLNELTFQVGLRASEATALRVGESLLPVKATDNFTLRGFTGRYQVLNINDASATLSLEGTVQVSGFNEGALKGLQTVGTNPKPGVKENIAYVVLEGKRGEAFSVTHSDSLRTFTGGATTPKGPGVGHVVARAVKINGEVVRESAFGEGRLSEVSFDVVSQDGAPTPIFFNGEELSPKAGGRVVVKDFLGTYVVFTVPGGLHKVKLDGVARSITTDAAPASNPLDPVNRVPYAAFSFEPQSPTTSTDVRFLDQSTDPDVGGFVLLRRWDFGDNTGGSAEPLPKHRFAQKGNYTVTLEVTDNLLGTNKTTRVIEVRNSPPQTDFTWIPKTPTTYMDIPFQDISKDVDGSIRAWSWDFGDGGTSTLRNPTHRYVREGIYNVTLVTRDNDGDTNRITKLILVRNSPPRADFGFSPELPLAKTPVLFYDTSVDYDGSIVQSSWAFPSLPVVNGFNYTHVFTKSGTYQVSHMVKDDRGDVSSVTKEVRVLNSLPQADFIYTPSPVRAGKVINFIDRSVDSDGTVDSFSWDFGDGGTATGRNASHVFSNGGNFTVTLTVTDNEGGRGVVTRNLAVDGAAPRAAFDVTPRLASTFDSFTFIDRSSDLDGTIVSRRWDFGDGNTSTSAEAVHAYADNCICLVNLTVTDDSGKTDWITRQVTVLNRAPDGAISVSSVSPFTGSLVYFNGSGTDRDGRIVSYRWDFGDGNLSLDRNTTHVFGRSGNYRITLTVTDDDGTADNTVLTLNVRRVPPKANFTYTPSVPVPNQPVVFMDASIYSPESVPTRWTWDFGSGSPVTTTTNSVSHTFPVAGLYTVTLTVVDDAGISGTITRTVRVNSPPLPLFSYSPAQPEPGTPVQFTDFSRDDLSIVSWAWSFAGEGSSNLQNPTFAFSSTGPKTVTLRVVDSDGAAAERRITINVQNSPPRAAWTVDPLTPVQNRPALFIDRSTDLGGVIAGWAWDFGDGDRAATRNVTHTYTQPGRYNVILTAYDPSGAEGTSLQPPLRVVADHPYRMFLRPILPDGTAVNLTVPGVEVRVRNVFTGHLLYPGAGVTLLSNGTAYAEFGAEKWAPGDGFIVTVNVPDYGADGSAAGDFVTRFNPVSLEVPLKAPLRLSLSVVPPQSRGILATTAGGNPAAQVFTDQTETVYVHACVTWRPGTPVRNAIVTATVTYTGTRARVGPAEPAYNFDPVMQRRSLDATTDVTGCVRLIAPAPLVGTDSGDGPYLPGWYEVDGEATLGTSSLATFNPFETPPVRFFEDPEGAFTAVGRGIPI
ncbi:MAG TPA: PKD domain-containing protein [Candidatus Thermoplasmatota archaeon]|nr:PKD domain-containing protein [Candidatus Thermoplasmatota archaeon]